MIITDLAMSFADESNPGRAIGFVLGRLLIVGVILFFIVRWLIRLARKPKAQPPSLQYGQTRWPPVHPQMPHPPYTAQPYRAPPTWQPQAGPAPQWGPPTANQRTGAALPSQWPPPAPSAQHYGQRWPSASPPPPGTYRS
ncbi:hypothetical protein [Mycobacterium adipatum]|uniref:hypothetical protein n=1 Tax=Mycobacterium adipatum TaxID=1682113 RepID=UPI000A67DC0F|nr:hypothetical protein [Mycobacterium adipatum]